ncbi:MAG: radical SAM protein, partial [Oscillospiraceae bacterium]|nr:radical SAM protein [Oscillospiraceae bacterium]
MKTYSVCPECNKRVPAKLVLIDGSYRLRKICPEHGKFSAVVWRGSELPYYKAPSESSVPPCPDDCGLCERHLQSTCCVLVELTNRCNLNCPVCFADAGKPAAKERAPAEWYNVFRKLVDDGRTFLQLSGGEPTVLDDLPEIVAAAKRAGCENIQLNSTGIRLGKEPDFTKKLADAGLSFVFMQFDGLTDDVYSALRGRPMFDEKLAAIDACDKANLGVTLVPTIVPGVNDDQIGAILKFGFEHSPAVRGVHYQPISYFGRYPNAPRNKDRITLPEVMSAIETQTDRIVKLSDLSHSTCDHPRCGFHGDFVVMPDRIVALTKAQPEPGESETCCCAKNGQISDEALRNRKFVSRRWRRSCVENSGSSEPGSFDAFL